MPVFDGTRPTSSAGTGKQLLRLATAGSVDDGKSTLIGRLLLDSKLILQDTLDALHRNGLDGAPDLASITDGLRAEREQGITIDVAYRYFTTPRRSFIIADTTGHERYTRNMVTGASTAQLAVILIDARHGINVVERGEADWYDGPPLLEHLEEVDVASDRGAGPLRLPVQWVIRPA